LRASLIIGMAMPLAMADQVKLAQARLWLCSVLCTFLRINKHYCLLLLSLAKLQMFFSLSTLRY
jgi:hypothetical protein